MITLDFQPYVKCKKCEREVFFSLAKTAFIFDPATQRLVKRNFCSEDHRKRFIEERKQAMEKEDDTRVPSLRRVREVQVS